MPLKEPVKGIIGACLTPFGEDERVDFKALEKEIDFLVADCDAVSIAAVEAAEYTMLSRQERKELLRVATEMVDKRKPVLLRGAGPSPREVIELAEYGASVGGDFIQVLIPLRPWGGQPTIAELMEFYTQVASARPGGAPGGRPRGGWFPTRRPLGRPRCRSCPTTPGAPARPRRRTPSSRS